MRVHIVQADDEKLYHCPQCPRVYKVKYSLVRHLTSECGIPPRFICPRCPYRSHYELNLTKHMKASWCRRHSSPTQSEQAITSDEDSSGSGDEQESDDPAEASGLARNGEPSPGSASIPTNSQYALQDDWEAKWVRKMLQQGQLMLAKYVRVLQLIRILILRSYCQDRTVPLPAVWPLLQEQGLAGAPLTLRVRGVAPLFMHPMPLQSHLWCPSAWTFASEAPGQDGAVGCLYAAFAERSVPPGDGR